MAKSPAESHVLYPTAIRVSPNNLDLLNTIVQLHTLSSSDLTTPWSLLLYPLSHVSRKCVIFPNFSCTGVIMVLTSAHWLLLSFSIAFSLALSCPKYLILGSSAWTCVVIFLFTLISRIFYALALYPSFFTPFKHLPTPPVRFNPKADQGLMQPSHDT